MHAETYKKPDTKKRTKNKTLQHPPPPSVSAELVKWLLAILIAVTFYIHETLALRFMG